MDKKDRTQDMSDRTLFMYLWLVNGVGDLNKRRTFSCEFCKPVMQLVQSCVMNYLLTLFSTNHTFH